VRSYTTTKHYITCRSNQEWTIKSQKHHWAKETETNKSKAIQLIYQWNDDLNIVTQQTEESKRAGEILENLKRFHTKRF
jgi:hypothetical protein